MKKLAVRLVQKHVIGYEIIAIGFVISIIWLDEFFDIPCLLLGASPSPFNWQEALLESIIVFFFGLGIIFTTLRLFKKMKYLEGILPVCASCKRIKNKDGSWQSIEEYIRDKSDAEFSHGICPECMEKLYPDLHKHRNDK